MYREIYAWLIAVIGALVAYIALKSRGKHKGKAETIQARKDAVIQKRDIERGIQTLDDDRVIDEFKRLHDARREKR